jgi:hypothetical protein
MGGDGREGGGGQGREWGWVTMGGREGASWGGIMGEGGHGGDGEREKKGGETGGKRGEEEGGWRRKSAHLSQVPPSLTPSLPHSIHPSSTLIHLHLCNEPTPAWLALLCVVTGTGPSFKPGAKAQLQHARQFSDS